ncbi:FAD-dependent oxidoreductase [Coralloluteibacterium stylophorae]|uniref:Kynurenine 3-monooxygenase n=2 Tax=Coralloluteibacterium stylophorae TaxID=1776034 RepID=A0AAP2C8L5_9GAMM|nr:NAD(P)/FAD-dependent oxidoreductase [Coralloluteibacterium stylophorae]MBS7455899.1 FAD-dependent monooxygenase [Coralloluteibacterium stylophorae]
MNDPASRPLAIVGAGLAGALMATLLARRGVAVEVYERRPDPRIHGTERGRSINLALAERGLHALRLAGLEDEVMRRAVMMRGRMVHAEGATPALQRYGRDDSEVIWSVSRGALNIMLLDAAEAAGARIHFDRRLCEVDFDARRAVLQDKRDAGRTHEVGFRALIGADGVGSALRFEMDRVTPLGVHIEPLDHGYKELEIPPGDDGGFRIEPHALHIWPRGGYMCIALPNAEASFTVTLFLPNFGTPGFDTVPDGAAAEALFAREFPDALPLIPRLVEDYDAHPVGILGTLYLDRWHLGGRAVLLGDAAHAMVPFHGQGMNCAFEDCVALDRHLAQDADLETAFAAYAAERRPDAAAIQAMALENYVEMRDRVDDADYLLQRALSAVLAERQPQRFVSRYAMVSFRRTPYAVAFERGQTIARILTDATKGKATLAEVDIDAAERAVVEGLSPLRD